MRLRQVALASRQLDEVAAALAAVFGLKVAYNDPHIHHYGLRNAVLSAGTGFLEIVEPVRADASARKLVESEGVDLRYYSVIYDVIDDVKAAINGLLSPEIRESIIGIAQVRDAFRSSSMGTIAGCLVTEGVVRKSSPIRVLRDSVVIYEGQLESLRRFKDDVSEVRSGTECGIGVKNYNDVKAGDQIEVFERTVVARTI